MLSVDPLRLQKIGGVFFMSNKLKTRFITYLATYTVMYVVLKYVGALIPFFVMPNGGSVEVELITVCLASYHLGWKGGLMVALMSWLITIVLGFPMYFVHPIQIALDYVLPLAVCGMASLQGKLIGKDRKEQGLLSAARAIFIFAGIILSFGYSIKVIVIALVIAVLTFAVSFWYITDKEFFGIIPAFFLKYLFTVISGAYFWAAEGAAGTLPAWSFSLMYNLGYNLVSMIVAAVVVPLLAVRIRRIPSMQINDK